MQRFTEAGKIMIGPCDSAFGSSGKGKFNGYIAMTEKPDFAISNNSAQASHVVAFSPEEAKRTRLKAGIEEYKFNHLPTSCVSDSIKRVYLTGGCVINLEKLLEEVEAVGLSSNELMIHPNAVIVTPDDVKMEQDELNKIASTMSGIAPAMCKKIMRSGKAKLAKDCDQLQKYVGNIYDSICGSLAYGEAGILEMAQGFGLSIDHGVYTDNDGFVNSFYPFTTSRNCDPLSFAGAAGIPHHKIGNVIMNVRTYPIRVGDASTGTGVDERSGKTLGSSGAFYPDQQELSWETISERCGCDVKEMTSLTKRVRRVFSFSDMQFIDDTRTIAPNHVFVNFVNYIDKKIAGKSGKIKYNDMVDKYPEVAKFVAKLNRLHYWRESLKNNPNQGWIKDWGKDNWFTSGRVALLGTGKLNHEVLEIIYN